MKPSRHLLPILALFTLGLSIRLVPLTFSNLPYNIDAFPLVRLSQSIIDSGGWTMSYPEGTSGNLVYNSKLPLFSIIMAEFALILGIRPMELVQFMVPIIASTAIITTYMLAYLITKNRTVAFFAGLALALNGLYVYFGFAVMKETIGLVFLPLIIYLYFHREDPRKRALAALLLLMLPLIHHLTTWIVFTMITMLAATSNYVKWCKGEFNLKLLLIDFISGPTLFIFAILYYTQVELSFFNRVSNMNDILLFLSVTLIGILFAMAYSKPRKKRVKMPYISKLILFPIAGILALIYNNQRRLFTGAMRTNSLFLLYFIPYILFAMIGFIGINIIGTRRNQHRPLIASMLLAPLTVMVFALLRGLDAFTFNLVYRSYDFIDAGLAICIGVGMGYIINSLTKGRSSKGHHFFSTWGFKTILSMIFLAVCLLTLPLAYNNEEFHNVQDITNEYEFEALTWLNDNMENENIQTNQRLADIAGPYFDVKADLTLPWKLRERERINGGEVLLMEEKWVEKGAQMYPMEPTVISNKTFRSTLYNNNLIYSGGLGGDKIYIVITT